MFKGYIKALIILGLLYASSLYLIANQFFLSGMLLLYGGLICLMPLAIPGSYRYRMAKTSWKGIRFGYLGQKGKLVGIFFKGIILSILTFGIYTPWFTINLRRYLLSNIKVGNAQFIYSGNGTEYFWMNVKGYFLTLLTLGIYIFWWQKDQFNFFVNNLRMQQDN